jgi:hypothetical protein
MGGSIAASLGRWWKFLPEYCFLNNIQAAANVNNVEGAALGDGRCLKAVPQGISRFFCAFLHVPACAGMACFASLLTSGLLFYVSQ